MTYANPDRLKRLRLRSWRRGTKEMDLLLGPFADRFLAEMGPDGIDLYERLLQEDDHDLYGWMAGRSRPPAEFAALTGRIVRYAEKRFAQQSDML